MHGIKLAILALAICLAISLFDGVVAPSSPTNKKHKAANKKAAVLHDDWNHIIEHLVDEALKERDHMGDVKMPGFKDKLLVHLKHPEHGKKHKLAVPHEMKNPQQLRAVFVRLEVARATHTLSLLAIAKHEGQFKKEIDQFIQADEKVDNYKGQKGTAKKVAEEGILSPSENQYFAKSSDEKVNAEITSAMKMTKIGEKIDHLTKEYEIHVKKHGKDHENGKDGVKDKKNKGLRVDIPPRGGSKKGSSSGGSLPPSPSPSPKGVGGGGNGLLKSPSGHHNLPTHHKVGSQSQHDKHESQLEASTHSRQTLDETHTHIRQNDNDVINHHREEQERPQLPGTEFTDNNGRNDNGNDDYTDTSESSGFGGSIVKKASDSFVPAVAGPPSFDGDNDFGTSEVGTQVGGEGEPIQEGSGAGEKTEVTQEEEENTESESAIEGAGEKTRINADKEEPGRAGFGGGEGIDGGEGGDMNGVVETDSAVGGSPARGLGSNSVDTEAEQTLPAVDDDDVGGGLKKEEDASGIGESGRANGKPITTNDLDD